MSVIVHDERPGHVPTWTIVRTIRHLGGDRYEATMLEKTPANPDGRIVGGEPSVFTLREGVARWESTNRILMEDVVRDYGVDKVPGFVKDAHMAAYNVELDALLASYRKADPKPSVEIMAEARANGARTLVNVLTGRRTRL